MSISGAMFAGVSGLRAQSANMGVISDNIANANTVGYKGSKAQFETLVTSGTTSTTYNPGGVRPHPSMMVSAQGLLNSSTSKTDIGIDGAGFFACTSAGNIRSDGSIPGSVDRNFTRAGSLSISKDGHLINSAGYALLGVPTNSKGIPSVSNPSIMSLQPATIGTVVGLSSPTTELKLGANLPSSHQTPSKLSLSGTVDPLTPLGAAATAVAVGGFRSVNDLTVYSSSGKPYGLQAQLFKTSPGAAGPQTYEIRSTGMLPLEAPHLASPFLTPPATHVVLGTITVSDQNQPTVIAPGATVRFTDGSSFAPNFDVSQLKLGTADRVGRLEVDTQQITSVVYDTLGVAHNLTLEFARNEINNATPVMPPTAPAGRIVETDPSGLRAWSVKIVDMTIVGTGAPSVVFPLAGAGAAAGFPIYLDGTNAEAGLPVPARSYLKFDTNGRMSINAPTTLPPLPMTTGASAFGGSTFSLNLGTPGTLNGMTSQSSEYSLGFIRQNGIPYGFRNGVEIDKDGMVRITFSNSQSLPVFKLPVITFANPNMLEAKGGNVWSETVDSGSALANYSGIGGAGRVSPASLEASTVDIATEFTNMIITQRSYAANSRSISTSDEMLQEVLNMKR